MADDKPNVDAPHGDDDVRSLLHRLLTEFDVLHACIDERDPRDARWGGPNERTAPVEDVDINQHEDVLRPSSCCSRRWSVMLFKRVARKIIGQHNADKSIDKSTPRATTEAEYHDPVVPTEGLPKV